MALRNQPYLPLYVQDIMTDEKLNECSAATHGIYIKGIMCLMHKSEAYGKILLKQKYKQTESKCLSFANQLVKHLPYSVEELDTALCELIEEKVCHFDVDYLCQKRMIKDNDISLKRSSAGKKGVQSKKFAEAKGAANSEDENENENGINNNRSTESFTIFWDKYQSINGKSKTDRSAAIKKWKAIKLTDQQKALEAIKKYFDWSMLEYKDVQFVKKARTYLNDRTWEDDFILPEKDPTKTYIQ